MNSLGKDGSYSKSKNSLTRIVVGIFVFALLFCQPGQPMALNNNGDTIDLIDPTAKVVQTVTYPTVEAGEVVTPAF